jgi:valyl-tRNA synthetase
MSKSKGNIVDPQMLLDKYGAEAIRIWAATEGDLSKIDFRCGEERIQGEKKSLNKLLNVSKFVMMFEKPSVKPTLSEMDSLFIDYIEKMTKDIDESYTKYDFNHPAQDLRSFLWDIFASNYIELVKNRAYNEEKVFSDQENASARYTLHFLLERFLRLIYPIIPQVSTTIASEKGIDLLTADWPGHKIGSSNLELVAQLMEFNSDIWKKKKDSGISLRDAIEGIEIPEALKLFESDLKACHKI